MTLLSVSIDKKKCPCKLCDIPESDNAATSQFTPVIDR